MVVNNQNRSQNSEASEQHNFKTFGQIPEDEMIEIIKTGFLLSQVLEEILSEYRSRESVSVRQIRKYKAHKIIQTTKTIRMQYSSRK